MKGEIVIKIVVEDRFSKAVERLPRLADDDRESRPSIIPEGLPDSVAALRWAFPPAQSERMIAEQRDREQAAEYLANVYELSKEEAWARLSAYAATTVWHWRDCFDWVVMGYPDAVAAMKGEHEPGEDDQGAR